MIHKRGCIHSKRLRRRRIDDADRGRLVDDRGRISCARLRVLVYALPLIDNPGRISCLSVYA